jgi:hypothetical protein
MPERVLRAMVGAWDHPAYRGSLRAVVEAAIQEPDMGNLVREVVEREMISQLAGQLSGADALQRAAAFGAQMAGIHGLTAFAALRFARGTLANGSSENQSWVA